MIQIDEKLKKEFYKDSINKELVIEFEGDSIDKTIAKNTEYQLKTGEKLYIMYTSESTTDSSTDVVKSIFYGPGAIIRPNFDLKNSIEVKVGGAS